MIESQDIFCLSPSQLSMVLKLFPFWPVFILPVGSDSMVDGWYKDIQQRETGEEAGHEYTAWSTARDSERVGGLRPTLRP